MEIVKRIERLKNVFKVETIILKSFVDFFISNNFYWFLPVITSRTTDPLWPDPGASIEKRISFKIYNKKVKLTQSMIIHKRVLVSLGYNKIFIFSPNIRIEKRERRKSGRHLYEFTQLDFEVANAKMEDIFKLVEKCFLYVLKNVKKFRIKIPRIKPPFKIYDRVELEEKYGKKWEEIASKKHKQPFWVTNLPREFYDYEDFETGKWRNYDLILPNGYGEVISGGEREWKYEKIVKKMKRDRLNPKNFKVLILLAKKGKLKPSAGAGIGVERFIRWVLKLKHVADTQPFPRIPGIVPEL